VYASLSRPSAACFSTRAGSASQPERLPLRDRRDP
jgi:hypothetical protein